MKYGILAFFALIWMGSAVITAAVETVPDPSDATGSADFESLQNSVFATEELTGDRPVVSSDTGVISASWSIAKTSVGYVGDMFRAASLSSSIWEGWALPIRYVILTLQLPMLLLLALEGAKVLSGFVPFT